MKFAMHEFDFTKLGADDDTAISEVIVTYTNQLDAIKSIEKYKGLRIVFDLEIWTMMAIDKDELVREINELFKVYEHITFRIPMPVIDLIQGCPSIIVHYDYAAGVYQEAMSLYEIGVRELYVTGALAASLRELSELSKLMKIRMIPNIVQTNAFGFGNPAGVDPLKCFWLRPEGVEFYEKIVSVMEFVGAEDDKKREAGFLHFYNMGSFPNTFKLGDVIEDSTGVLTTIDNTFTSVADQFRSTCRLACQANSNCQVCARIPGLAVYLREAGEKSLGDEKAPKID